MRLFNCGRMTHNKIQTSSIRPVFQVQTNQMLREAPVIHLVHLVEDEVEQIKSRDEGRREVDIGRDGEFRVISRIDRVGGGQNGCSGVQGGDNACFGDGDGLLFLTESAGSFVKAGQNSP